MLDLLRQGINPYLAKQAAHQDPVLKAMEARARREGFPIVGPQVGRLLFLLTKAIRARRVFEIGSGYGYSALWFSKALPRGGRVTTTEYSEKRQEQALAYLKRAGQAGKVRALLGDGIERLRRERASFDVLFLDADKRDYPKALRVGLPKLKVGGLFIADNVLWSGKILGSRPDAQTRGILSFTRNLKCNTRLATVILPLRDGVSVSLKLR